MMIEPFIPVETLVLIATFNISIIAAIAYCVKE